MLLGSRAFPPTMADFNALTLTGVISLAKKVGYTFTGPANDTVTIKRNELGVYLGLRDL